MKCPICETIFNPKKTTQKYCSKTCSSKSLLIRESRNCKNCGKQIWLPPRHLNQKAYFCSKNCLKEEYAKTWILKCEICKTPFPRPTAHSYKRKYCTTKCRNAGQAAKHLNSDGKKICTDCGIAKNISDFGINQGRVQGYCIKCRANKKRNERKKLLKDPIKKAKRRMFEKNFRLLKHYNITLKDYNELLKKQGGVCWICKELPKKRSLDVDHCHKTGKVRGLLCNICNTALGRFKDDLILVKTAARYLEENA